MPQRSQKEKIVLDPQPLMDRYLHYKERHHGWYVFRSLYWSAYLVIESFFLIYYNTIGFTEHLFLGLSLLIFALMFIIYGLAESLHHKLMKRYG